MNEIIKKLSTYNIFNYLFPGIVFVVLSKQFANIDLIVDDIMLGMFFYYFIGLLLSRIGSVLIEPTLKKTKIIKFSNYHEFVKASKIDEKIELLSEVNNMYRTIISMLIILLVILICTKSSTCTLSIVLVFLVILFILSYRKQTSYIAKRVDQVLKEFSKSFIKNRCGTAGDISESANALDAEDESTEIIHMNME